MRPALITIIPAFRVDAVVRYPGRPSDGSGRLLQCRQGCAGDSGRGLLKEDGGKAILDEWIYGCADHDVYMQHYISVVGLKILNALKARAYYSAPAVAQFRPVRCADEENKERVMGTTLEELEQIMKEKGCFMRLSHTLDELLTIVAAVEIRDYENVVLGVGLAYALRALWRKLCPRLMRRSSWNPG
ncbi:MAG: hypothetical protein MZV70_03150 [Desulfobacterales bacterium]|nr:hypothetical protein [Desulfobacterales bacterium]